MLKILHLEDEPKDVELARSMLETGGIVCEIVWVETESDFVSAVEQDGFDLILADYNLPLFNGMTALEIAKVKCPNVPFILLSGNVGEELAIESLKRGAADYVLKHRMQRLVPVVRRALQEAEDQNKRKQAECALRESETRVRALAEASFEGIIISVDGTSVEANRAISEMFGYELSEVIGKTPFDLLTPESAEKVYNQDRAGIETPYEIKGLRKDGTIFDIEVRGKNCIYKGQIARATGFHDITDRKQSEKELKESEEKYRQLFENESDAIVVFDADNKKFEDVNIAALELFGYTKDEFLSLKVEDISFEREKTTASVERIKKGTIASGGVPERSLLKKDGSVFQAEISPGMYFSSGRKKIIGAIRDITERSRAQDEVSFERDLMQTLLNNTPDYIYFKDKNRRFVRASKSFCDLFGQSVKEIIGKTDEELFPIETAEEMSSDDRKVIETGMSIINKEEGGEIRDEGEVWVLTTKLPWIDKDSNTLGLFGISRDITDRKKLERQLIEAQKMEAIGQLVGGITHEFNNLLLVILANTDFAMQECGPEQPSSEYLFRVNQGATRARDLVKQLLTFSRQDEFEFKPLNLNTVVEDVVRLLTHTLGKKIELKSEYVANTHLIQANKVQIHQILINLCLNARDAMPDGGKICIETQNLEVNQIKQLPSAIVKSEKYVQLRVIDNGEGMDSRTSERIFEPFFTTKKVGHGTGLGMSVVYGIVKQHESHIEVSSERGKGTTVTIYFPALAQSESGKLYKKKSTVEVL